MQITPQQVRFFEDMGFLKLPQAFRDDLDWITREFEQVFVDQGRAHSGTKRSCLVPFIDQREEMSTLLDHPTILAIGNALLGEGFNYLSSDGNYYCGDTAWHPDGNHLVGRYIKLAFYLDPLRESTGALRVIPASHHPTSDWMARSLGKAPERWGIAQSEIPAYALETDPGDLLIFNHNIMHASFGGSGFRRMFTLNLGARANTPAEIKELKNYLLGIVAGWGSKIYTEQMLRTAGPERLRHLAQPQEYEYVMSKLPEERRQAHILAHQTEAVRL